jgi:hypothetical protein
MIGWKLKLISINTLATHRLSGDLNNNKMERFNGEVRDKEKVMRNLKKKDTPLLDGYQIYHNFIKETPAEMCGLMFKGDNKWKKLIENASSRAKSCIAF